ncbi:MAG: phenylalanine--tRNA ligase subunit beta [Candidatus Colwellbacteria bacterium]|nr:phenylalanine--tRNA ligase subunit beta [Candidatus Colwellbacteria bacterium]
MKFSYTLIRQLVPGIKSKENLVQALHKHSFESESLAGNTFNSEIPHNHYSSAASHWGVARETSAVLNLRHQIKDLRIINFPEDRGLVDVRIENSKMCPRYMARVFDLPKFGASPAWMQKILKECGLRPINAVVDIMNYAMLETGQPLHAFDGEKIVSLKDKKVIYVRGAKPGEHFEAIDGNKFKLDPDTLIIADKEKALAIAGIKGGKNSEVGRKTRRIIVESANFDPVSIYKTSKRLGLATDASLRFAHDISPLLVQIGMDRATVLLKDFAGAKLVDSKDISTRLPGKKIIEFSVPKFNSLSGLDLKRIEAVNYLKRLEFKILDSPKTKSPDSFLVEVPPLRDDVSIFEDLVEEVVRLYGLYRLRGVPPVVGIAPAELDDPVKLKDKVRNLLQGYGFSELYNSSFVAVGTSRSYEVLNPISADKKYLRTDLLYGLRENLGKNSKFFETLRIFEIGKVFHDKKEELYLGIAVRFKGEPFLDLKGVVGNLLERMGLVEIFMKPEGETLRIESDHSVIGFIKRLGGNSAAGEINLDKLLGLVGAEDEYRPIPKYPGIMRDLSLLLKQEKRVGDVEEAIWAAKPKYVSDVDLIDYYDPKRFTFRIVFLSDDHTLTDREANAELAKIVKYLKAKFKLEVR